MRALRRGSLGDDDAPAAAQRRPPMLSHAGASRSTTAGYVAAAYLVFLALLLIYVAIMAGQLSGWSATSRELDRSSTLRDEAEGPRPEHVA